MLQLKEVVKEYPVGDSTVTALNGVSVAFRNSEFVAILGQSGCGKTTLLNIIGGLDRYTSGDLLVNGRSTKDYSDADWDAYRNHSIGFVFQSYNLIPHQSVLANVEMALELSGVPKAEQRKRATEALERVGLGDQLDKKPTMMSGGQMQRVAIARAIVNNPDIILADEPTGALDSKTSVQIMDLLKEIAADRLVIMVTHNPELAEQYATRIVRLSDGSIVSDTKPLEEAELADIEPQPKPRHTHLPFLAALGLSANNLRTKKGRAFLTAFAGAIGIIGIALILSLSSGMNDYIHKLETDVMGSYPIEIDETSVNMASSSRHGDEDSSLLGSATEEKPDPGQVTSDNLVAQTYRELDTMLVHNDLGAFRTWIEDHRDAIDPYVTAISYSYSVKPQAWRTGSNGEAVLVSPRSLVESEGGYASTSLSLMSGITCEWRQLVDNQTLREDHFYLEAGAWPQEADEVALVVDEDGQISDFNLYALGYLDIDHMQDLVDAAQKGEDLDDPEQRFSYDEMLGREYTVFSPSQLYAKEGDVWVDRSDDQEFMDERLASGEGQSVHVVGVLRARESASYTEGMVYTGKLTQHLMAVAADTQVVKDQLADPDVNVLTGTEFGTEKDTLAAVDSYVMGNMASMMSMAGERGTMAPAELARPGEATMVAGPARQAALQTVADGDEAGDTAGDTAGDATGGDTAGAEGTGDTAGGTGTGGLPSLPDLPQTPTLDEETLALLEQLSKLSPEQRALLLAIANGEQPTVEQLAQAGFLSAEQAKVLQALANGESVDPEELVSSGLLTQEQLDRIEDQVRQQVQDQLSQYQDEAQAQMQQQMQQYLAEHKDELLAQYLGSLDTDALLAQYLGSLDTNALLAQYLSSMDPQDLMAQLMASGAMDPEALVQQYLEGLTPDQLRSLLASGVDMGDLQALMAQTQSGTTTYDGVLSALGYAVETDPAAITFYPVDFEGKHKVQDFIAEYNAQAPDDQRVAYTDLVGLMTKSITEIIDIITAVLVAFVSISLVVSSIMIAIITYISVLERTKEIGIMRALGASKTDITKIFNAETFIEGLLSGVMGVAVTMLLNIPICDIIYQTYGAENIAVLPWYDALLLIAISIVLTFIAGFVPARLAARKDPVEALRSE